MPKSENEGVRSLLRSWIARVIDCPEFGIVLIVGFGIASGYLGYLVTR